MAFLRGSRVERAGFRCDLSEVSLSDLLQLYHQARRSISVLVTGPIAGHVQLDAGEIINAESDDLRGIPALSRLLEADSGALLTDALPAGARRSVSAPFHQALLEATQAIDERRRDGQRASGRRETNSASAPLVLATASSPGVSLSRPLTKAKSLRAVVVVVSIFAVGSYAATHLNMLRGGSADTSPRDAASRETRPPEPSSPAGVPVREGGTHRRETVSQVADPGQLRAGSATIDRISPDTESNLSTRLADPHLISQSESKLNARPSVPLLPTPVISGAAAAPPRAAAEDSARAGVGSQRDGASRARELDIRLER